MYGQNDNAGMTGAIIFDAEQGGDAKTEGLEVGNNRVSSEIARVMGSEMFNGVGNERVRGAGKSVVKNTQTGAESGIFGAEYSGFGVNQGNLGVEQGTGIELGNFGENQGNLERGEIRNEQGQAVFDAQGKEVYLATEGATEKKIKSELKDGDNISQETAREVEATIRENKNDPARLNQEMYEKMVYYLKELYNRDFGDNNHQERAG